MLCLIVWLEVLIFYTKSLSCFDKYGMMSIVEMLLLMVHLIEKLENN